MREQLIDWMHEVSSAYDLRRETFYLAYHYINLYLDKTTNVTKKNFQLVGTAALFIASKMEEVVSNRVKLFVRPPDRGYSKNEILSMEWDI
jgi:hypothetical protein